jgi:hypothetical protein
MQPGQVQRVTIKPSQLLLPPGSILPKQTLQHMPVKPVVVPHFLGHITAEEPLELRQYAGCGWV